MHWSVRKNLVIILAFLLPIGLIAALALGTYLPSLFLSTDYNFVYVLCVDDSPSNNCMARQRSRYTVVDQYLVIHPLKEMPTNGVNTMPGRGDAYTERFFFHDTNKNESREITLAEVQALTFSPLLTSPDGVTIVSQYDRRPGGGFLFFDGWSSDYAYYLTKGRSRTKLHLIQLSDRYFSPDNFQLIGWVVP